MSEKVSNIWPVVSSSYSQSSLRFYPVKHKFNLFFLQNNIIMLSFSNIRTVFSPVVFFSFFFFAVTLQANKQKLLNETSSTS